MRFDGFVRVLRFFLTQTELFLHFRIHETKKQSAGFFYFFILEDFDRLEFLFSHKIDRTGVDLEKYCENQKSGSVVTSAALVRFRKILGRHTFEQYIMTINSLVGPVARRPITWQPAFRVSQPSP